MKTMPRLQVIERAAVGYKKTIIIKKNNNKHISTVKKQTKRKERKEIATADAGTAAALRC